MFCSPSVSRCTSNMSVLLPPSQSQLNVSNSRPHTSSSHYFNASSQLTINNSSSAQLNRTKTLPFRLFSSKLNDRKSRSSQSRCSRISQIENGTSTAVKNLTPSFAPRKPPQEPWQKLYDGDTETLTQTPTYLLMKNNQAYNVIVKEDFFTPFSDSEDNSDSESVKRSNLPPIIQEYVDKLMIQINELQLYLEEERFAHRNTKQQAQEYLKDQLRNQTTKYESLLNILKEEYSQEKEALKNMLIKERNEERAKHEANEQKLKAEFQVLSGSFQSYKTNIVAEYENLFRIKEDELTKRHESESDNRIQQEIEKLNAERSREKRELLRQQKAELELIRKQKTSELNNDPSSTQIKVVTSVADKHRIEELEGEIKEKKDEIESLKESLDAQSKKLRQVESQLVDKTVQYNDLRVNFDAKLKQVDDRYKEEIDDLLNELSDLRILYMKKCDELYDERQMVKNKLIEKSSITRKLLKKKLFEAKNKAQISIAPHNPKSENKGLAKTRRSSVPTTETETQSAESTAGNLDHFLKMRKQKFTNVTPRPASILKHTDEKTNKTVSYAPENQQENQQENNNTEN